MEQLSLCRTLSPKEPWICSEPEGRKKRGGAQRCEIIKIYQHTVTSLKSGWEALLICTHLKLLGTFLAWQYSFSITFPRTHGRLDVPDAEQQSKTTQQRLETANNKQTLVEQLQKFIFRGFSSPLISLLSVFRVAPHLVWGQARRETPSAGSRGWVPPWTARSCRVSRPGWSEPNRLLGNWGKQTKTLLVAALITWIITAVTVSAQRKERKKGNTYSRMAILSECREDTDDMLWDICIEDEQGMSPRKDEGLGID